MHKAVVVGRDKVSREGSIREELGCGKERTEAQYVPSAASRDAWDVHVRVGPMWWPLWPLALRPAPRARGRGRGGYTAIGATDPALPPVECRVSCGVWGATFGSFPRSSTILFAPYTPMSTAPCTGPGTGRAAAPTHVLSRTHSGSVRVRVAQAPADPDSVLLPVHLS